MTEQGETTVDLTPGLGEDQEPYDEASNLRAENARLATLVRAVYLGGTGFVWTDRATDRQHVLHPADVAVYFAADQESLVEAAYRAGRADAARDIQEQTATLCMDGTGRHLVDTCARIARGEQLP